MLDVTLREKRLTVELTRTAPSMFDMKQQRYRGAE